MELEEAIEDVKKYISFANKEENFSSTFEFNWHKDLANRIDIILKELDNEHKSNMEWYDIADSILKATDKYGEISIGEIPNYIENLLYVIDLITEELKEITGSCPADIYEAYMDCDNKECNEKECFIEYFYKKAEEENE